MRGRWACLAVLACLLASPIAQASDVADDEYADTAVAHLVVHKSVAQGGKAASDILAFPEAVQGRNVTVEAVLYNAGSSTATDVVYTDALPKGAELVEGSLKAKFPKLAVGSSARHNYTIRFTDGQGFNAPVFLPAASVAYVSDSEVTLQTGLSSRPGVYVLSPIQQLQRWLLIAGQYATLSIMRTADDWRKLSIFVAVVGGLFGTNWAVKQAMVARRSSTHKKALKHFESE